MKNLWLGLVLMTSVVSYAKTEVLFVQYDDEFVNQVKLSFDKDKIQVNQNANLLGGSPLIGEFFILPRPEDQKTFSEAVKLMQRKTVKKDADQLSFGGSEYEVYVNDVGLNMAQEHVLELRKRMVKILQRPVYRKNRVYELQMKKRNIASLEKLQLKVKKYKDNQLVQKIDQVIVDETLCSSGAFTGEGHCQTPYGAIYFHK